MKTLKNFFGTKETRKSMNAFVNTLNVEAMIKIKGGENDDDGDLWPPKAKTGSGS